MRRWSCSSKRVLRGLAAAPIAVATGCSGSAPIYPTHTSPRLPEARASQGAPFIDPRSDRAVDTGWRVMAEPLPKDAALAAIHQLCDALARESIEELSKLSTPEAWMESQGERRSLVATWSGRFGRLPYEKVNCHVAFDLNHITLLPSGLGDDSPAVAHARDGADVLALVPILQTHLSGERLFPAELIVGLASEGHRYLVSGMVDP